MKPIYFDLVSTKTIAQKGVKTVKLRSTDCERRHVTVAIAIAPNENGHMAMIPGGCTCNYMDSGYMDSSYKLPNFTVIWLSDNQYLHLNQYIVRNK